MKKKLITEKTVKESARGSKVIYIPETAIITALARDTAKQLGVRFLPLPKADGAGTPNPDKSLNEKIIAVGCDHGGYSLKVKVIQWLKESGYTAIDVGTHSAEPVDYPDFAAMVAEKVSNGDCGRGIMIDGAGIGSCMVVNKFKGVRGALCYDLSSAINSREHNCANVLTLGAKLIGEGLAEQIIQTWLKTPFTGGRHQNRIDKIIATENKNFK